MRKFAYVLLGCLALAQAHAASFDCASARTSVEKMICADPELSSLDEQLDQAYRKALQRPDVKQGIVDSQRQWLKRERNACADAACLKRAYQNRLNELSLGSSFGIVMMRVPPGQKPPAPAPQPPAARPPEPGPAEEHPGVPSAPSARQTLPHAALTTLPPVCAAIVEANNGGKLVSMRVQIPENGLLADINGDGKKEHITAFSPVSVLDHDQIFMDGPDGKPTDVNPLPDDERSADERLIQWHGEFYILGGSRSTPQYLARIGRDNVERIVCDFGELKPAVTIIQSSNDALCKLGLHRTLHFVPFDTPMELTAVAADETKLVSGEWDPDGIEVSVGRKKAASVDINNDGVPDRVADIHISTASARLCTGNTLAVLDNSGRHLDRLITPLLPGLDCTESQAPFIYSGETYIEAHEPSDVPSKIMQLKGTRLDTICQYYVQPQIGVVRPGH